MGQPIVLALQQVMERQGLRRAIGPGPIGLHALRDDLGTSGDALQLQLERRRLLATDRRQGEHRCPPHGLLRRTAADRIRHLHVGRR